MRDTSDGFAVAEQDLIKRGPGDFFGRRQHGLPDLRIADLLADMKVLESAREAAQILLGRDALLKEPQHALLRQKVERLFTENGDVTFN